LPVVCQLLGRLDYKGCPVYSIACKKDVLHYLS